MRSAQVLFEEGHRASPGNFGLPSVVNGDALLVHERMIRIVAKERGVLAGLFQAFFEIIDQLRRAPPTRCAACRCQCSRPQRKPEDIAEVSLCVLVRCVPLAFGRL
jgi:hypothetical protein